LFIGIWFVFQFVSALGIISSQPGIAFVAHVGGFVAGYLMARPLVRRRRRPPPRVVDFRIE
ncbi:MAG: rhomboid family intramembrane serine protease, partial [Planctomycetes bacterium]|nr:rhomboid family intramembrane serine protease [Planctomycetota bacterium]